MNNWDNIKSILQKIDTLKKDLYAEYESLYAKYWYFISKRKIIFSQDAKSLQRLSKINLFRYVSWVHVRHFLSMPFIYSMIIPWIILDIFLSLYQFTALPLYGIPRVRRSDHFVYDRRFLSYLNTLQKVNCLYCSYMNWLFSYAMEIWGRTEQYWCPIKHAMLSENEHKYFIEYADYWNAAEFKDKLTANICFKK